MLHSVLLDEEYVLFSGGLLKKICYLCAWSTQIIRAFTSKG